MSQEEGIQDDEGQRPSAFLMALSNSRSVSVSRVDRFPLVQTAAIDLGHQGAHLPTAATVVAQTMDHTAGTQETQG
jgi:hypothetical protein